MAKFSNAPFDKNAGASGESAADYCKRCLINENTGPADTWVKSKCHLPVKTASGVLSKAAIRNAAARLNQVKSGGKQAAAAKLERLKKQAGIGQDTPAKKKKGT
jgi:hypothetical protein